VLLERNIFENNNIEKWTGFYPSSVKIFNQSHRNVVRENLVINHPHSSGVWWDVGNNDGVFVNNHVENVKESGFFFEISNGAIVAGNVFENCDQSIFVLNSSNVQVFNNTMINSRVNFRRDNRGDQLGTFGWHVTTGPGVEERDGHVFINNLLYVSKDANLVMLQTGQPSNMCDRLNKPHLKAFNNNVFVHNYEEGAEKRPIIEWMPFTNEKCQLDVFSPEELNGLITEFSTDCQYIENIEGSLFADLENKDFQLTAEYSGVGTAAVIPANVAKFMGLEVDHKPFVGAVAP
jgi:parallel beta-helix repeat protein